MKKQHGRALLTAWLFPACSVNFCYYPGQPAHWVALHLVSWTLWHQSVMKKMFQGLGYRPSDRGNPWVKVSSSLVTPACVKLEKKKGGGQHTRIHNDRFLWQLQTFKLLQWNLCRWGNCPQLPQLKLSLIWHWCPLPLSAYIQPQLSLHCLVLILSILFIHLQHFPGLVEQEFISTNLESQRSDRDRFVSNWSVSAKHKRETVLFYDSINPRNSGSVSLKWI